MRKKRKLKPGIRKAIRVVTILALLAVIGVSGYQVAKYFMDAQEATKAKQHVTESVGITLKDVEENQEPEPFTFTKDNWDKAKALYPDFIGWMAFEDQFVSEPIVQGTDNDFYLKHYVNGQYSEAGAVFVDAGVDISSDQNSTLYGHNVAYNDRDKFSPLTKLVTQEEYDKHNRFSIYYEDHISEYVITNVYLVDTSKSDFMYEQANFTDEDMKNYLAFINSSNLIKSDVSLDATSRFLTLQTCRDFMSDVKVVLNCKEVRRTQYEENQ